MEGGSKQKVQGTDSYPVNECIAIFLNWPVIYFGWLPPTWQELWRESVVLDDGAGDDALGVGEADLHLLGAE